jgi:hypothetical protein
MSVLVPNVPNLPGVPQVGRLPGAVSPTGISIASNIVGTLLGNAFGINASAWGIFDSSGKTVVIPDAVLEFEHHPRWRISDFPVQGTATAPTAFASYNKVKLPFECRMRICKASSLSDRQALLTALDTAANSIALYTITTPERNYQNADIESYDVVRTTEGMRARDAYFLTEIDIHFIEIVSVQAQYSTTALQNAQNPSAQPQSVSGITIPQAASGALANQAAAASLSGAFGAF